MTPSDGFPVLQFVVSAGRASSTELLWYLFKVALQGSLATLVLKLTDLLCESEDLDRT